jgi:hypothetical protein
MMSACATVLRRCAMTNVVRPLNSSASDAWISCSLSVSRLRRRLVEDEDLRIGEDRAGDGETLALPARELEAALADERVVFFRQRVDELVRVGAAAASSTVASVTLRRP